MAGLCAPLPTLRRHPRERQRTAQGRCGSLLLHRGGLSPPTPCRSSRRTEKFLYQSSFAFDRRVTRKIVRGRHQSTVHLDINGSLLINRFPLTIEPQPV